MADEGIPQGNQAPVDAEGMHWDRVPAYFRNMLTGAAYGMANAPGPISSLMRGTVYSPEELAAIQKEYDAAGPGASAGSFLGTSFAPDQSIVGELGGQALRVAPDIMNLATNPMAKSAFSAAAKGAASKTGLGAASDFYTWRPGTNEPPAAPDYSALEAKATGTGPAPSPYDADLKELTDSMVAQHRDVYDRIFPRENDRFMDTMNRMKATEQHLKWNDPYSQGGLVPQELPRGETPIAPPYTPAPDQGLLPRYAGPNGSAPAGTNTFAADFMADRKSLGLGDGPPARVIGRVNKDFGAHDPTFDDIVYGGKDTKYFPRPGGPKEEPMPTSGLPDDLNAEDVADIKNRLGQKVESDIPDDVFNAFLKNNTQEPMQATPEMIRQLKEILRKNPELGPLDHSAADAMKSGRTVKDSTGKTFELTPADKQEWADYNASADYPDVIGRIYGPRSAAHYPDKGSATLIEPASQSRDQRLAWAIDNGNNVRKLGEPSPVEMQALDNAARLELETRDLGRNKDVIVPDYTPPELPGMNRVVNSLKQSAENNASLQSAFRDNATGVVYRTGPFHDVDTAQQLGLGPSFEDGFALPDGSFFSREEAQQLINKWMNNRNK